MQMFFTGIAFTFLALFIILNDPIFLELSLGFTILTALLNSIDNMFLMKMSVEYFTKQNAALRDICEILEMTRKTNQEKKS